LEPPPPSAVPAGKPWSGGGREELADAVRRLMALTVTASAPPGVLLEAARQAGSLADELEDHVLPWSGGEPKARFAEHSVQSDQAHLLATAMPFDVVIGSCNPVALPLTVEFDPPKAIGLATFTAPYEGAPGCVHGAVLAGAFDIMLTAANVIANGAGPTVNLSIRYRKPTLVAQPARFEAWVTEQTDRRTYSRGHLIQGSSSTWTGHGSMPCTAGGRPGVTTENFGHRAAPKIDRTARRVGDHATGDQIL
jgi:acyl-coenzyme A thioesterase PaaI-like protein